jgi:long-chain fatty acid transport protein
MSRGTAAALAALWIAGLAAEPAVASPLEMFGFGGRSPGMAGGGVAVASGYESVYLNPAGLAGVRRKRLTLGAAAAQFSLDIDGADAGVDTTTASIIGGALPVTLGGALADRVVLGLGFHIPNKALVRVDRPLIGEPTFALLDNRADAIGINAALGVEISERWSAGAGFLALAQLRGKITVSEDASGAFITSSDQNLITHFAPIAGARYRAAGNLDVGLTARAPSRSDYEIEVDTDVTSIPLSLPELAIAGNAQYDPLTVALGVGWRPSPRLSIIGELEYRRWSAFPRPTENPVIGDQAPPAPGFSDTAVPRLAAEITVVDGSWSLISRAGYAFHLSPAPEMTGPITLLDNHRHVAALGIGLELPGSVPLTLDVWAQVHVLHDRTHDKDPAAFPDEPPFDSVSSGGSVATGGLTLGVDL